MNCNKRTQRRGSPRPLAGTVMPVPRGTGEGVRAAAEGLLAERYAPPWVGVNEEFEVVQLSPRAEGYLLTPAGTRAANLLEALPKERRTAVRRALSRTFAEGARAVLREVTVGEGEGAKRADLLIEPLDGSSPAGNAAVVVFEALPSGSETGTATGDGDLATANRALRGEVAELRQANGEIERLLASSEIATLVFDVSLRLKRYTPAMAGILKLVPADLGRPLPHLAGIIDWRELAAEIGKVLETLLPVEREVTAPLHGRHYLMRVLPSVATGGDLDGIVVTMVDLTERKRAEESIRQSELQFRTLADAIPHLCWIANADGWIFWYNRRWYQYTGASAEEMEGWGWQSVHDPQVLPHVLERWQASLATGAPFDMTFPLRGADGVYRPFLTRVLPMRERNGKVVRWFGTNTDIADQSRSEHALQRSNQRLNLLARIGGELLANESPQGVVNSICREVVDFLDCHTFFNFLVDERHQRLRLNAWGGISEEEAKTIEWLDFGEAICGCAARDACRLVVEDVQRSADSRTELAKSYGIQAYACHPLVAQGRVLGTLSFGSRTRSRFSGEELALMNGVADLVAIAMERKLMLESLRRAHDELEQRVRERTEELAATVETLLGEIRERERAEEALRRLNRLHAVLSEIDQAIVRALDKESLFRDFCRIAVEDGGFVLAWVGLLDQESGEVRPVAASGDVAYLDDVRISAHEEPEGEGPTGISLRKGTYYICNDFQNDPCTRCWHENGRKHGILSSASIALKEEERVIGALTLYAGEKDFFDRQHVALLRQMGADISFALDNLLREARRREAERALRQETLERLQAVEALREKERLLIHQSRQAAMGEMIGNIAHQWRQPLNTLGLLIQELSMRHELGDCGREFVDDMAGAAMGVIRHMSQTIDDFRNFFRPEKEMVQFRPRGVLNKVISIVEASLREQRIRLDLQSAADPLIYGYPNEYSQVILNILLNARDVFVERRVDQPLIEVRLAEEKGRSVVTIADNAGGIPGDIIDRIFDPYFTTKGPDKGTGVGLYMSKAIVEKNMNGRLTARNNGSGAEFRIEV